MRVPEISLEYGLLAQNKHDLCRYHKYTERHKQTQYLPAYTVSFMVMPSVRAWEFSMIVLFLLHRHVILLSAEEGEARMLGVNVSTLRLVVLLVATLVVASVVSLSGLISFVGLLAPHGARLMTKDNRIGTMLLSGLLGGILLNGADILVRSVAPTELPVSIFTSLLGAPFLVFLIVRGRRTA